MLFLFADVGKVWVFLRKVRGMDFPWDFPRAVPLGNPSENPSLQLSLRKSLGKHIPSLHHLIRISQAIKHQQSYPKTTSCKLPIGNLPGNMISGVLVQSLWRISLYEGSRIHFSLKSPILQRKIGQNPQY